MGKKNVHKIITVGTHALIFIIAVVTALAIYLVQNRFSQQANLSFQKDSEVITQRIVENLDNYNDLLYSGRAFVSSSASITQADWKSFYSSQASVQRYKGLSSIYYIKLVRADEARDFENKMRLDPYFGINYSIRPKNPTRKEYAVANLVYSKYNIRSSLGFDTYSTPERRSTYQRAETTNSPTASAPLQFETGSIGLFIALPVFEQFDDTDGFVGLSVRLNDFISTVVPHNPQHKITMKITDVTDKSKQQLVYKADDWESFDDKFQNQALITVGNRQWSITYKIHKPYIQGLANQSIPTIIVVCVGLFGLFLTTLIRLFHIQLTQTKRIR